MLIFILSLSGLPKIYSQQLESGIPPLFPVNGFIVLNTGDTLDGKIKYKKLAGNYMKEIRFTSPDGTNTFYEAGSIRGMGLEVFTAIESDYSGKAFWDLYECRPLASKGGEMVFMNRFLEGKIIVFQDHASPSITTSSVSALPKIDGIAFEYSPGEGLIIGPTFRFPEGAITTRTRYKSYYFEKKDRELTRVSKDNYESLWPVLFGDCTAINAEIDKNPDLKKFKNFIMLVCIYNEICK